MNTIRSTWIGWGSLCAAGGGAYYFAKKSINAERAEKHNAMIRRQELQARLEDAERKGGKEVVTGTPTAAATGAAKYRNGDDVVGSPSSEASRDPAPTRHAPENEAQGVKEKSKYEATEVYRSRKGDRFS